MKKINFKKDLKKMAIAGIASGTILLAQTAGAVEVKPATNDTHLAAGCGSGCKSAYRPQSGCNGKAQPTTTQNYPRSNRQIAENDIFTDFDAQRGVPTNSMNQPNQPGSMNQPGSTNQMNPSNSNYNNARSSWETSRSTPPSSATPSTGHACSTMSPNQNRSYQSMPRPTNMPQGTPQSYNQPSQHMPKQVAESDIYYPPHQGGGCQSHQPRGSYIAPSQPRGAGCGGAKRSPGHSCA